MNVLRLVPPAADFGVTVHSVLLRSQAVVKAYDLNVEPQSKELAQEELAGRIAREAFVFFDNGVMIDTNEIVAVTTTIISAAEFFSAERKSNDQADSPAPDIG